MKRIYEDIPVRSVLYVTSPFQPLHIYDFENEYELSKGTDSEKYKVVYVGTVGDSSLLPLKIDRAKIRGIDIVGGVMRISICTRKDEYEDYRL